MFQLGIISDEVSQNLREAAAFAKAYGLSALELRSVNDRGPFEWAMEDAQTIKAIADEFDLSIAAISSPLFKCSIHDEKAVSQHIAGFRRCAEYCHLFGCKLIRGFDFWDCGASLAERAEKFAPIIEICREYGITCALEYDPSVHASTPKKIKEIVESIHDPCIRALFDPGNGLFSTPNSHPYPDDYHLLKPLLVHIHMKDAICTEEGTQAVKIGDGQVNYPEFFQALKDDGYEGYLMLETHYRLNAQISEELLKLPGGSTFSQGAYAASKECMEAIQKMMNQLV
ncbi:MAG: sugar phosphate isomerase/epimerase [Clostridiales bacterium]|nr:sugar phosphate isomerase/epimerase [Clostridiales bacterium]